MELGCFIDANAKQFLEQRSLGQQRAHFGEQICLGNFTCSDARIATQIQRRTGGYRIYRQRKRIITGAKVRNRSRIDNSPATDPRVRERIQRDQAAPGRTTPPEFYPSATEPAVRLEVAVSESFGRTNRIEFKPLITVGNSAGGRVVLDIVGRLAKTVG